MSDLPPEKKDSSEESKASAAAAEKPRRRPISWKDDELDVRYKFWHLTAQYSSLVVAIAGFWAVWSSLENNTKSVRANVQNVMLTHVTGLNRFFMERPELYPYFYEGKKPPDPKVPCRKNTSVQQRGAGSPCYLDLFLAATSIADVLDIVDTQSIRFRDQWEDPDAWDTWIKDSMKQSPILREYLRKKCRWYGKRLIRQLKQVEQLLPEPEEFPADCEHYLSESKGLQ